MKKWLRFSVPFIGGVLTAMPTLADTMLLRFDVASESLTVAQGQPLKVALNATDTNGYKSLRIHLPSGLGKEFSRLTGDNIGETMTLTVCGEVLSDPVIRERIGGPDLAFALLLPQDRAQVVADRLANGRCG